MANLIGSMSKALTISNKSIESIHPALKVPQPLSKILHLMNFVTNLARSMGTHGEELDNDLPPHRWKLNG